ncbi:hypothetical protein D9M70_633800 [compost metagenome]
MAVGGFVALGQRFKVVQNLPEPGRGAHGGAQVRQRQVENQPAGLFESGPAIFAVGHRLPIGQFDQGIGVGFEQLRQEISSQGFLAQADGRAIEPKRHRVDRKLHHGPG